MSSSSNFVVRADAVSTTTRPNGARARSQVKNLLGAFEHVIIDLKDVVLTPSFADEFLGVLLVELGEDQFRKSITIINVSSSSRPLLQTILHRRASKPRPVQSSHDLANVCG